MVNAHIIKKKSTFLFPVKRQNRKMVEYNCGKEKLIRYYIFGME